MEALHQRRSRVATAAAARLAAAGRGLYAVAILGFGILHVGYGGFVTRAVPWWPSGVPGRTMWAYVAGAVLGLAGASLLLDRRTRAVALALAAGLFVSFAALGIPLAAAGPRLGGGWTVAGKILALAGGALLIAEASATTPPARAVRARLGAWGFAAFLVLCGIQHFIHIGFVETLVPGWLPGPRVWAYAAGVALIAGGAGLVVPRTSRLAGLWAGLMIGSWVLLVHLPRALRTFPEPNETVALFEAIGMTGIAWLAAPETGGGTDAGRRQG